MVGRDDDVAKSLESDPSETTCVRRARDGLVDHPSRQERVLTDGWNCEKVVVGSNLRAEARMKSGHSVWTKYREASEIIDLHGVFNDYWTSNDHEFTVLSQSLSPRSPRISNWEGQRVLSLESIMGLCNYGSLRIMPFVLIIFAMSHPPS